MPSFKSFIYLSGQILTSLGAFYDSYPLMQFSRFVFGMGGESLAVAQNTYASAWFSGDALNMVFGLQVRDHFDFDFIIWCHHVSFREHRSVTAPLLGTIVLKFE